MAQQITPYHHLPGLIILTSGVAHLNVLFWGTLKDYIFLFLYSGFHVVFLKFKLNNEYLNKAEGAFQQFILGWNSACRREPLFQLRLAFNNI
jgi:hypothetical protein